MRPYLICCGKHLTRLEGTDDWHTLQCPRSHYVDRDYASVMNMMWKTTLEAWSKGVWWDLMIQHLCAHLKTFTASEQSPAVLARGSPMNPAGGANEGWARKPPKKGGGQKADEATKR